MAEWKVSKEIVEIVPHFNSDSLELARVGHYQVIVKKGEFNSGDRVIFIPEKSILPIEIADKFRGYLVGPDKNRVKSIRLRGEVSCGILIPADEYEDTNIGVDISSDLDIKKYEPPIPMSMSGKIYALDEFGVTRHDCEHFGSFCDELVPGERILITEKIHGSQFSLMRDNKGVFAISSKGLLSRGLALYESEGNIYWVAAKKMGLLDILRGVYSGHYLQIFGEVIPCQKGFTYGKHDPTILFFDVRVDGVSLVFDDIDDVFKENWVPIIYDGDYDPKHIREFANGNEQVSGRELHISEGVVVRPYQMRRGMHSARVFLKILNPKYKETGDEFQ